MSKTPTVVKYVSNLLVLLSSFSLMISLGEFYTAPIGLAIAVFIGSLLTLVSFIGLRMMKKWSMYIFSGLMFIIVCVYCYIFQHGYEVDLTRVLYSSLIPAMYYSVAAFYWNCFE